MKKTLTSLFTLIFLVCFSTNYLYAACEICGCNKKEKTVKTCIKTGKVCDAKCENKKNATCCKGESKKNSCSKEKTSCSKEKISEKQSCSKKEVKKCCKSKEKTSVNNK